MKIKSYASAAIPMVFAALLASCSVASGPGDSSSGSEQSFPVEEAETFVYQCDYDFEFVARVGEESSWLFLPRRTVELPRVVSGSGVKYTDGDTTFWNKGEHAWFAGNEGEYKECRNNRPKAIWEHAKLSGVDFRAQGNEPGWHVEIRPDSIIYVGDYGNVQHRFERPEPQIYQQERTTIYETAADGVSFNIRIRGRECQDSMSGEEYSSEVTIWVNGRELHGCGRALH